MLFIITGRVEDRLAFVFILSPIAVFLVVVVIVRKCSCSLQERTCFFEITVAVKLENV